MRRVYLDHGATSFPKAPGVAAAMAAFLDEAAGSPGRGGHRFAVAATRVVEDARERVAGLLGGDPDRTILGPGATFFLNALLLGMLREGNRVVVSALEHNSVMRPLRHLARERGVRVRVVEAEDPWGVPAPEEMAAAVAEEPTRLVVVTHASNVTGEVLPVAAIARAVAPVPVVVDGAQGAGSVPFDFGASGAAAYVASGHKGLLGPTGIGVLLVDEALARDLPPLVRGGTGSRSESEEMPAFLPDRLEAGTPNTVGAVGLGAACTWLAERTVEAVAAHELALVRRAAERLAALPRVRLHGWRENRPRTGLLSFTVEGLDVGELAARLDRVHGLAMRVGLHCAPAAHRRIGTFPSGTIRAGFGPFNVPADADLLADAVAEELR